MARPAVDVVVPFAGRPDELAAVRARFGALDLRDGDTLTVVDDGAGHGSYAARNRGAAPGRAEWLLFCDADAEAPEDLLDRYFAAAPGERSAVLAGGVRDAEPGPGARMAERYAHAHGAMSQAVTLEGRGRFAFAQTANCAVRRAAFEAAGGFRDDVRSGGDADLCFRLATAGWELERREDAAVVHHNRMSVLALARQRARHGAGAAWLAREHPGSSVARRPLGLAWWSVRRAGSGVAALTRGDLDAAAAGLLDGPLVWAFELGRLLPNRPRRRR
jgi:cellulose synthase/poly-beta-1,6-N-acetylglucosamine synthase-like glycosyltransferase